MEAIQSTGKKLDKIVYIAIQLQWLSIAILAGIIFTRELGRHHFPNYNYRLIAQGFSALMILRCIIITRVYTYYMKKYQQTKLISSKEQDLIHHEKLGTFLWPLVFWVISFALFSWLS